MDGHKTPGSRAAYLHSRDTRLFFRAHLYGGFTREGAKWAAG